MLNPSAGREDILDFIVDAVSRAGSNPCPPVVVGGGAWAARRSRLPCWQRPPCCARWAGAAATPFYAALEAEALERINALGIGPRGWAGPPPRCRYASCPPPTHIAGLPCCVNLGCHVTRHASRSFVGKIHKILWLFLYSVV